MTLALAPLASSITLLSLPSEVLLLIFSYLDVPELLYTSRTTHHLRRLCLDPLLHTARLLRASLTIERSIPCRPPLSELIQHRIYISRTSLAARDLGRNLIKIKLNRSLARRPSPERLVQQGVLPEEYLHARIAPSLISTKRRIEKERIKDALRHWVEEWSQKATKAVEEWERERQGRPDVRILVRRFAREAQGAVEVRKGQRWSEAGGKSVEMPTRAKVLGLRRFWEKVGKAT